MITPTPSFNQALEAYVFQVAHLVIDSADEPAQGALIKLLTSIQSPSDQSKQAINQAGVLTTCKGSRR